MHGKRQEENYEDKIRILHFSIIWAAFCDKSQKTGGAKFAPPVSFNLKINLTTILFTKNFFVKKRDFHFHLAQKNARKFLAGIFRHTFLWNVNYLARLASVRRPDNSALFHFFHQTRGAVVADFQPALNVRRARLSRFHHDVQRL